MPIAAGSSNGALRVWCSSSGYLVDGEGQPGGGGLLLLQAADYREAEALIQQDQMLLSGGVEWTLQEWRPAVGDLGVI